MKRIFIAYFIFIALISCQTKNVWTKKEIQDWHLKYAQENSDLYSTLRYIGTDDKYHYFVIRAIDSWVNMKVIKEEIEIKDIRPLAKYSSDDFLGYYSVDPQNGFKKTEKKNL